MILEVLACGFIQSEIQPHEQKDLALQASPLSPCPDTGESLKLGGLNWVTSPAESVSVGSVSVRCIIFYLLFSSITVTYVLTSDWSERHVHSGLMFCFWFFYLFILL